MKKQIMLIVCGVAMMGYGKTEVATFAGGCFWCMEAAFEKLNGIGDVISGYMGGSGENPTYQDYAQKGFVEVVQVMYDPEIVSYQTLLDTFWHSIDPVDAGGQFGDRGPQYRSAIFFHTSEQEELAEESKEEIAESGVFIKRIVTEILPATTFYPAEEYHQDYYKKNPTKYAWYRYWSGRDAFLQRAWPLKEKINSAPKTFVKPSDEELRKILTPLQYAVTQEDKTEPPFDNLYWDTKEPGIYVDIVSGEPLFSSKDKFDSGTGWPSFTKPITPDAVVEREIKGWFSTQIEVRSRQADSHLGHVFKDGPPPTGLRYCMNSAALRFVPQAG